MLATSNDMSRYAYTLFIYCLFNLSMRFDVYIRVQHHAFMLSVRLMRMPRSLAACCPLAAVASPAAAVSPLAALAELAASSRRPRSAERTSPSMVASSRAPKSRASRTRRAARPF